MSIVKGLIKIFKGDVWLESSPGQGSKFLFTIPYENIIREKSIDLELDEATLDSGHFTILVAEDDPFSFMYLQECLSSFHCTILHANNGEEAIKSVFRNPSIDLILMDINMPVMNGDEAFKEIRKTNEDLPVIAQTGLAMAGDKEKMLNAGIDDYLSKPISPAMLITTINKHLKKKPIKINNQSLEMPD